MLTLLKLSLHINIADFDNELNSYIAAAESDLDAAGVSPAVDATNTTDPLYNRAVMTYAQYAYWMIRDPQRGEGLLKVYEMQKAQLMSSSGRTDWGEI